MRVILQKSFTDCGFACLAMVCDHHRLPIEYSQIASALSPSIWASGLSMKLLRDLCNQVGLRGNAFRCPLVRADAVGFPFIAHCKDSHYVVVESVKKGRVKIVDPRYGRIELPESEFEEMYSGNCLQCQVPSEMSVRFPMAQVKAGVWIQKVNRIALGWSKVLALTSLVQVVTIAGAIFLSLFFLSNPPTVFPLFVLLALALETSVCRWVTERYILSAYASAISDLSELCSRKSDLLLEIPGGYRVEERVRWIAEHVYQSRWNTLSAFKLFWGLILFTGLAIALQDWRLLACALGFASLAFCDFKRRTGAIDFSPADHSARRFISAEIEGVFRQEVAVRNPQLVPRNLSETLSENLAALAAFGSMLVYWWGEPTAVFHRTIPIVVLASQLKLFDWWCMGRQGLNSWLIVAHSYSHLSFMSLLRQIQATATLATKEETR